MKINHNEYRPPGTHVSIEFEDANHDTTVTEFHTLIIGSGVTVRDRIVERKSIKANTKDFPYVNLNWEVEGEFNFQHFNETSFDLQKVYVHKLTQNGFEPVELEKGVDYEVVYNALARTFEGAITTTIKILETSTIVEEEDIIYDMEIRLQIDDEDLQYKLIHSGDKMYLRDVFGEPEIKEGGEEFFNDIAMASEIAFKTGVQKFFYLEVPRNYGEKPKAKDFKKALEEVYYERNAYRIVPLTDDPEVINAVVKFVDAISNPVDKRECVSFVSYENNKINDHSDLFELIEKVGTMSTNIKSKRINNVYFGDSVELSVGMKRYILPPYFMNAAIAFLDAKVGMADPISTRIIDVFDKINGPRFRPRDWNRLAELGVFIVYRERKNAPAKIRHQLTTMRGSTSRPELVEYSSVKNLDATVQLVRDRLDPYAGKENIVDGFFEKVDSAFTTAIEDAKDSKYIKGVEQLTPWEIRKVDNGLHSREIKTNIFGKYRLFPVYPGNNIDVLFLI